MAFSDEINKLQSTRTTYVRVTPGRNVTDTLSFIGSNLYTVTIENPVSRVTRIGSDMTAVNGTPTSVSEYNYNEDTKVLTVYTTTAPSSTNRYIAFFDLFLTDGVATTLPEDPVSGGTDRIWEPRIKRAPTVTQSIKDATAGVVSFSASTLSLVNTDQEFNKYLGDDDSFYNKDVVVWSSVNGEVQRTFAGTVNKVNLGRDVISLSLIDKLFRLDQPAAMGDKYSVTHYRTTTGLFVNMDPEQDGTPVPYIFGKSPTSVVDAEKTAYVRDTGSISYTPITTNDTSKMHKSVCINTTSGSGYRQWGIARTDDGGFKTLDFGTVSLLRVYSRVPGTGVGRYYLYNDGIALNDDPGNGATSTFAERPHVLIQTSGHNLEVGDSFELQSVPTNVGTLSMHCVVDYVTSGQIRAMCPDFTTGANFIGANEYISVSSSNLVVNKAPAVVVRQGQHLFYPVYGKDYTVTETFFPGGNKYLYITFVDGFEKSVCGDDTNQNRHLGMREIGAGAEVYFRATPANQRSHGTIVHELVEGAGLEVNTASITAANTAFSGTGLFSIPAVGQNTLPTYLHYMQKVLQSSFGYIYLNDDFEVVYKLWEAPSSNSNTRDHHVILDNSINVNVDYNDIVTTLEVRNMHDSLSGNVAGTLASFDGITSDIAEELHETEKSLTLEHVLNHMDGRVAPLAELLANRKVYYKYTVATADLNSNIGDDITLETDRLIGTATSKNVKIVGISKDSDKVVVTAMDLLGL